MQNILMMNIKILMIDDDLQHKNYTYENIRQIVEYNNTSF